MALTQEPTAISIRTRAGQRDAIDQAADRPDRSRWPSITSASISTGASPR